MDKYDVCPQCCSNDDWSLSHQTCSECGFGTKAWERAVEAEAQVKELERLTQEQGVKDGNLITYLQGQLTEAQAARDSWIQQYSTLAAEVVEIREKAETAVDHYRRDVGGVFCCQDAMAELQAALSAATKRADAYNNLAVANGERAAEEYCRAEAAEHRAATAEARVVQVSSAAQKYMDGDITSSDLQAALDDAYDEVTAVLRKTLELRKRTTAAESALQEALAREAGKDAAFHQIMKLRHHTIDGRAVFDADEVEAIARQAVSDKSLQEMRSTSSTTTPHPWGEVVRAAQELADTDVNDMLSLGRALREVQKTVSALPASAAREAEGEKE